MKNRSSQVQFCLFHPKERHLNILHLASWQTLKQEAAASLCRRSRNSTERRVDENSHVPKPIEYTIVQSIILRTTMSQLNFIDFGLESKQFCVIQRKQRQQLQSIQYPYYSSKDSQEKNLLYTRTFLESDIISVGIFIQSGKFKTKIYFKKHF